MKTLLKTTSTILTLLIGLCMSIPTFAKDSGKATISGEVTKERGMVNLYYGVRGYNMRGSSQIANRKFVIETELNKPEFLIFWATDPALNQFNLYLKPNDKISINIKENKIVLSGEGSAFNQFYVDMSLQYPFNDPNKGNLEAYNSRIKAINACKVPEVVSNKKALIGQTQGEYLDAIFGEYIRAKVVPPADPLPKVQDSNLDIQFTPELAEYYNWTGLLNELFFVKVSAGNLKIRNSNTWVADFANYLSSQALKEAYIVDLMHTIYESKDLVTIHDLAKEALPLVKDKANVEKINSILQKAKEDPLFNNALPGTDLSSITFKKPDGSSASIGDYKGKIIFIDIWATWCAPCIAEMPFLKQIEHDMAGDDIVFLSVCGNTEETQWLNYLQKNNPTGEQLWMIDGTKGPFFKQIGPTGIPRFVIIDKAGKMLNPKSFLRPSDPILKTYLEDLVKR